MALCTMCYQSQNAHPIDELPTSPVTGKRVAVCKGCAYQITRILNYLGNQGLAIQWGYDAPDHQRTLEPQREDVEDYISPVADALADAGIPPGQVPEGSRGKGSQRGKPPKKAVEGSGKPPEWVDSIHGEYSP